MPAKAGRGRHHRSVANDGRRGPRGGLGEDGAHDATPARARGAGPGVGVAIGLADSSPGWDSTGITAGALFVSAAAVRRRGARRPWLWALLVGLPTPILDVIRTGNTGSVLALGFAAAGAAIGWAVRRAG